MVKVLVVEAENVIRKNIKNILEKTDFKVFTSENHEDGLELAKEILPDVILSGSKFSGLSGYKFKEELNKSLNIPFIFILLIDSSKNANLRNCMALGADDYILKPFKNADILNTISLRLEKRNIIKENLKRELENTKRLRNGNEPAVEHILVNVDRNPYLLKIKEITSLKADGEYSRVYLANGSTITICKTLKKWENILPSKIFIRTHRSTIINLNYIEKMEKWYKRSYVVHLKNIKETFMISQRYASRLKETILFK